MQLMLRALVAAAAGSICVAVVGCGSSDESLRTSANLESTVSCEAAAVTITFDPRTKVAVKSAGRMLATASFSERGITEDCREAASSRTWQDGRFGRGHYSAATIHWEITDRLGVHVNPIVDSSGDVIGSSLSIASGLKPERIASAVLKNQDDPQASRIYFSGPCRQM